MLKHDAEKVRKALTQYDDLVTEHGLLVALRDKIKNTRPKELRLAIVRDDSTTPNELAAERVPLSKALFDDLHEWLVERLTTEVAANVRAQERVASPAVEDLHAKNGAR